MDKLTSIEEFRAAAREDGAIPTSVQRLATGPAMEVEGAARTLRFCFSDGSVDRAGDTINPNGWELDSFNKNPVALWAHDSWSPPIGRAANVGKVGKRLMGDIEFAPADAYPFAETIFQLSKGGFINATSVGFNPLEWTFVNEADRPYGIDFKRQELLEISICPVPCNANALMEARAKGIDTRPMVEWAEKVLDEGGSILVPKSEIDGLRRAASETAIPKYYLTGAKNLTVGQIAEIKTQFEAWQSSDKADVFVVPEGCELKATEVPEVVKAGRRISAANADALNKAVDHIKSVINSNEPEETPESDPAPAAEVVETVVDPKAALRESAKATLAAARAA